MIEQVVPIPLSKASQVRSGFVSAAKEIGFSFQAIRPGKWSVQSDCLESKSILRVTICHGLSSTPLIHFFK